jgi:hypothetical protein
MAKRTAKTNAWASKTTETNTVLYAGETIVWKGNRQ